MLDKYFPLYAMVFLMTLLITAFAEKRLIPVLSGKANQPIYEEGPKWHKSKSGTPTMGGLAFISATAISLVFSSLVLFGTGADEFAVSLLVSILFALLNSLVGIFDDLKKLKRRENRGLSPKEKLILQTVISLIFLTARRLFFGDGTSMRFSFGEIDFGFLYYPITLIMLLGIINCANLTDGIDGLASGVAFAVGVVLFYVSASIFTDVALISSAVMGGAVGFLIFNMHPAKIFMGDTGSLFFGALIVSAFFTMENPLISALICGVYVIEGVSVILQVLFYKATKKRLFLMAPLHHHLEKIGLGENKICLIAIILTFLLSIPAFVIYLP